MVGGDYTSDGVASWKVHVELTELDEWVSALRFGNDSQQLSRVMATAVPENAQNPRLGGHDRDSRRADQLRDQGGKFCLHTSILAALTASPEFPDNRRSCDAGAD